MPASIRFAAMRSSRRSVGNAGIGCGSSAARPTERVPVGPRRSMRHVADPLRLVTLGDSYTIGTSVPAADRWPNQLVRRFAGRLDLVANLGVNGYASSDV